MGRYVRLFFRKIGEAFRKGDLVLLLMCLALTAFGMLMIASTTHQVGSTR
jgi:cell division protein FtsW (lipid II flippase)